MSLDGDGNLVVEGSITAKEFHTEFVSASIIYQSGSTKFGDTGDDIHQFTGSIELLSDSAPTITLANGGGTSPSPTLNFFRQTGVSAFMQYDVANKNVIIQNSYTTADTAGNIQFKTRGNNTRMHIAGDGKVGIGTTSPTWKVEVAAAGLSESTLLNNDPGGIAIKSPNALNVAALDFGFYDSGTPARNSLAQGRIAAEFTGTGTNFHFLGSRNYTTGLTENLLTLLYDGNVGIGTTAPSEKLYVNGGNIKLTGGGNAYFKIDHGNVGFIQFTDTSISAPNQFLIQHNYAQDNDFRISRNTGGVDFVIDSGGKTGLGTADPTEKLQVVGNISGSDVYINNWGSVSASLASINSSGYVDGSGTANYLTYWSDADTIAASNILQTSVGYKIQGNSGAGYTRLHLLPPATKTLSLFEITNGSDENNASATIYGRGDSSYPTINAISRGTGTTQAINFAIDSSEKMRIHTDGNVGIGTTSPSRKLQVQGTANTALAITSPNTNYVQLALGDTDDDNYSQIILDNLTNKLQIQNGGGSIISDRGITLDSSENVGIGTASPTAKLHVSASNAGVRIETQQSGASIPQLFIQGDKVNGSPSIATLVELKSGEDFRGRGILYTNQTDSSEWYSGVPYTGGGYQIGYDSANGKAEYKVSSSLFINTSGNVGIGTDTPTYQLDIYQSGSTQPIRAREASTPYRAFEVNYTDTYTTQVKFGLLGELNYDGNGGRLSLVNNGNNPTNNWTQFKMGSTVAMHIAGDGDIGIGTTAPDSKLEVSSAGSTQLKVTNATNSVETVVLSQSGDGWIGTQTNHPLKLGTGYGAKMIIGTSGNVGIGTTSPDASAILDIASTSKGVVFPRMTKVQRASITSPTTGLIVYQTDSQEGLYIYKSTGWVQII